MTPHPTGTLQRRVLSDLINYLPARLLPALTSLVSLPLYTHWFTPDEFGRYVLAYGLSELLMNATATCFAAAAVRFFASYQREGNLRTYFSLLFISWGAMTGAAACGGAALLLVLRPVVPASLYPLLWVALVTYVVSSLSEIMMNILRAQERSRAFSLFEIINRVGTVFFSIMFVLTLNVGVAGLLWGQTLTLLLTSLALVPITLRGVRIDSLTVTRPQIGRLWGYALPLAIGYVAAWWLRTADRYLIGAFTDSYQVGLYSVSYNVAWRSIFLVISLFLLIPQPMVMRAWEEQGRAAAEDTLHSLTWYFVLIIVPLVVGFTVLARPLVQLLAADEYLPGTKVAGLVACAMAAQGLGEIASQGAYIGTLSRKLARNQIVIVVANFLLNLILIPLLGFMGAALNMCGMFMLLVWLQSRVSARVLTWRWPWRTTARVVLASGLMGLAVSGVIHLVGRVIGAAHAPEQAAALVIATLAGCGVYGVLLMVVGEVSPHMLRSLFRAREGDAPSTAATI